MIVGLLKTKCFGSAWITAECRNKNFKGRSVQGLNNFSNWSMILFIIMFMLLVITVQLWKIKSSNAKTLTKNEVFCRFQTPAPSLLVHTFELVWPRSSCTFSTFLTSSYIQWETNKAFLSYKEILLGQLLKLVCMYVLCM